jgi:CRISPR-associated endonuclease Cas2
MRKAVKQLIKPMEDNVRFYELCGECIHRVRIIGGEPLATVPDVFIVCQNG